jgi:Flp pilus assembly protein TadB
MRPCSGALRHAGKEKPVLWTIAVVFAVLWLLGFVTSYTMGGLIHVLLVVAVIVIIVQLVRGRRTS